jgi:hypothetical protein
MPRRLRHRVNPFPEKRKHEKREIKELEIKSYLDPAPPRHEGIRRVNGGNVIPTPEQTKLFEPSFISRLEREAKNCVIHANRYKDENQKWLPADIVSDPLYALIAYLREREQLIVASTLFLSTLPEKHRKTYLALYPKTLPEETVNCVDVLKILTTLDPAGPLKRRIDLLQNLYQEQLTRRLEGKLPFPYFAALVAARYLRQNILPYKQDIQTGALKDWSEKTRSLEGNPPQIHSKRIYKKLGLTCLPAAPTHPA